MLHALSFTIADRKPEPAADDKSVIKRSFVELAFDVDPLFERTSAKSNAAGSELQDVKKFSWATVRNLWTRMMHAAKMVDSVDFKGFQAVMKNFFSPNSELDYRLLERLFMTFDVDGDRRFSTPAAVMRDNSIRMRTQLKDQNSITARRLT